MEEVAGSIPVGSTAPRDRQLILHDIPVPYYVYILRSKVNSRLYTGSTENLQRRIEEHNSGRSKATRQTRPFELLHWEEYRTRSEAIKIEKYLKTGLGRKELAHMISKS
jgi:putative endonuclease